MNVIETRGLTRRYKDQTALDNVTLDIAPNRIYGLLGRNGAGKTTLMSILTAQGFASSGEIRVFGGNPFENEHILSRLCFVRESQKYPDDFTVRNALDAAAMFFPNWDADLAQTLLEDFQLPRPRKHRIKKLSRGQLSAVGVIIGLASRAELTFFDEPYLGLDAVARQLFYDRLLTDFADHPRTIILSSHLIDEVANLLEHVIVIDRGRIALDGTPREMFSQGERLELLKLTVPESTKLIHQLNAVGMHLPPDALTPEECAAVIAEALCH